MLMQFLHGLLLILLQAVQLIVHIARSDWPDKYPDFYNNILLQISSSNTSTTILGLLFLQTASEELGTPRDGLLHSRKFDLKQRLLQLVPQTLVVLTGNSRIYFYFIGSLNKFFCFFPGLLQNIWEKKTQAITSTPPPSPTNPLPPESSISQQQHLPVASNNSSNFLNSEAEPVARLALQCLTHLFTWIPLSSYVTPQLMELIFRFVGMGTEQTLPLMNTCNGISLNWNLIGIFSFHYIRIFFI